MRREYRVITFSLTDEQNSIVSANVPIRDYEVFDTDEPTDLIAIGGAAVIINAKVMNEEACGMIFDFLYRDQWLHR